MVAKSYQKFTQIGEPFTSNGKLYIQVQNPANSAIKTVRWYSDSEYTKLYAESPVAPAQTNYDQHKIFGFDDGYITIFKGNTYENIDWFRASPARYARSFGWYFISNAEIPSDLPEDVQPIKLYWDDIKVSDTRMKDEATVRAYVDSLIYEEKPGEYVGNVGDRLELDIEIISNLHLENDFGSSHMHKMKDDKGNIYIWTTSAKDWPVGSTHHIRGTVKAQKVYKGEHENILTRCMEVKAK